MSGFLPEMKGIYIVDSAQKALVPWIQMESGAKAPVEGRQP
jgi:membrane protease subunit HflK